MVDITTSLLKLQFNRRDFDLWTRKVGDRTLLTIKIEPFRITLRVAIFINNQKFIAECPEDIDQLNRKDFIKSRFSSLILSCYDEIAKVHCDYFLKTF